MSSVTNSSRRPSHATPRKRILTANIYISTLEFIAALLLTLMLLWHISTVTLVENYQMPDWWVKAFLAAHANGRNLAMWVVVVLLVPIDCLHALLCLDWWCFMLHGREAGYAGEKNSGKRMAEGSDEEKTANVSVQADTGVRGREEHDVKTHAPTLSRLSSDTSSSSATRVTSILSVQPHTYHPLLHQRLSPQTQSILLSILDIITLAILTGYIMAYFISLQTAIVFCNVPAVLSAPDLKFGEDNAPLSMQGRCIGLNVDIHIAGGFAVFMAIMLGLLHIAALAVRVWEHVQFGKDRVAGEASVEDGLSRECGGTDDAASGAFEVIDPATLSSSMVSFTPPRTKTSEGSNTAASITIPPKSTSIGAEERSTGIRSVNWRAEQTARRRTLLTDSSETSKGGSKWGEMLSECLIDA